MAKDKVREASEAIKVKAKIAMADLSMKSPRVAIKVSMSAPVILVPERSNSLTGLMLDLGHLNIRNSFSLLETIKGNSAVQDSITINLNSLKIARSVFVYSLVKWIQHLKNPTVNALNHLF